MHIVRHSAHVTALVTLLAMLGCASAAGPAGEPDADGRITALAVDAGGQLVVTVADERAGQPPCGARASLAGATLRWSDGAPATSGDVAVGQPARVWLTGARLDSCPAGGRAALFELVR